MSEDERRRDVALCRRLSPTEKLPVHRRWAIAYGMRVVCRGDRITTRIYGLFRTLSCTASEEAHNVETQARQDVAVERTLLFPTGKPRNRRRGLVVQPTWCNATELDTKAGREDCLIDLGVSQVVRCD